MRQQLELRDDRGADAWAERDAHRLEKAVLLETDERNLRAPVETAHSDGAQLALRVPDQAPYLCIAY